MSIILAITFTQNIKTDHGIQLQSKSCHIPDMIVTIAISMTKMPVVNVNITLNHNLMKTNGLC